MGHFLISSGHAVDKVMDKLRVSESTVLRWRKEIKGAIWLDALYLQTAAKWSAPKNTVLQMEGDEKNFASFSELLPDGRLRHQWRPYIMFLPRGDGGESEVLQPCWVMSLGVTESHGEKKAPRLSESKCEEMLKLARVGADAEVVLFTDGGSNPSCAYRLASGNIAGIVQQEGVDHSGKQYARTCLRKGSAKPDGGYTWVPGVAGDNKAEGAWKHMWGHMDSHVAFERDVTLELTVRCG